MFEDKNLNNNMKHWEKIIDIFRSFKNGCILKYYLQLK